MSLSKYAIWDKQASVLTPSGEVFTADQWKERYPIATIPTSVIIGGFGTICGCFNGSFFGELSQMKQICERAGCDFTDCTTDLEVLEKIEEFEATPPQPSDPESTPEERIAAALETQVMMAMTTVNDDDPDAE